MTRSRRRTSAATLCLVLLVAASCRQVIGIEDAETDPGEGPAVDPGALEGEGGSGPSQAGGPGLTTATPCERYCGAVTQNCTGEFAVYANYDNCLAVCAVLPQGTEGDSSGNSTFCRLSAAQQAPAEIAFYCPAAGPSGNGVCGDVCESYCTLLRAICTESLADELNWDKCQESCAGLTNLGTYTVDPVARLFEGNNVQCRIYHASAAAVGDTEAHCQHASGESPCH